MPPASNLNIHISESPIFKRYVLETAVKLIDIFLCH